MKTIKNIKEIKEVLDKNKDLILDEDVRIEFQVEREIMRNVVCKNLYLENNDKYFDFKGRDFNGKDFKGRDFNGGNFNGRNFNGWNFNGKDFKGRDFNGGNFNGWNFNGKKISYWAFFCARGKVICDSI